MSLRSFRRSSMSSMSRVKPSASKRFDGLKYSRSDWSRSVIATDFEFETVLRERLGGFSLHPRDVFVTLLVHLLHRHFRGDRAQRGNELAREQRMQSFRLERAPAERRRGDRYGLSGRLHANIKVGFDVDAHPVARDDGVALLAHDLHRQHVHVDRGEVVDERQHEGAAVDHDPLSEKSGAHERHFLRRPVIEPVHHIDDHHNHDDCDDQPEDQRADQ